MLLKFASQSKGLHVPPLYMLEALNVNPVIHSPFGQYAIFSKNDCETEHNFSFDLFDFQNFSETKKKKMLEISDLK